MRVIAWNRTPRAPGVDLRRLAELLAESHVVSLHLLLNDETRGFLDAAALAAMQAGRDPGQYGARRVVETAR